jgi:preprotein translocase subunit SecA
MFGFLLKKISGRHYRKFLAKCRPVVERINALEKQYQTLPSEAIQGKTAEFRARLAKGEALDALLPEAFAVVKNAARRLCGSKIMVCEHELEWNMVHFDVQLIGGMALHQGKIAEMATGEGKTLVATLPLYLNALTGQNAQLVTVNDYLARRDSQWMGYLYNFLGLTVGCIQNQMQPAERRAAYACDITYGTASEFGFDYLRDNGMAGRKEDQVQRGYFFCIVDEVDSILVDEARTPLIISGPMAIDREQPFPRLKPVVERLASEQTRLCNRLASEAKDLLEKSEGGEDKRRDGLLKLLQVKTGAPKNKLLLRLMETPEWRKLLDKTELEMNSDYNKEQFYRLKEDLYFVIDERQHQADLTEKGRTFLKPDDPDAFVLPDLPTIFSDLDKEGGLQPEEREARKRRAQDRFEVVGEDIHAISQLLRAYSLYEKDVEYVVQDGKVVIVDENTGRIMPGRRWSDGLHAAVEAKEGVVIERETRTYATITIQNFFRMYRKLAGMTGTAETEATEFTEIYKLDVVVIPTNRPCVRADRDDVIYKTRRSKYGAVVKEIEEAHKRGQPVLVGTVSVEASEILSRMLRRVNIPHAVLNAKYHQQEADIVARAGQRGAVTIATNMAGRGTDIKLGEGVPELGGLCVIGTERHESRRIDRQLRGRCARQGDPGLSKFYISLEDDLMRLFASAGPLARIMEKSMVEDEELTHPLLNRSIESAQKKVEQQNFSIRKRLLQYDDVLNQQRAIVYAIRNDALHNDEPRKVIFDMVREEMAVRLEGVGFGAKEGPSGQALDGFVGWLNTHFPVAARSPEFMEKTALDDAVDLAMRRVEKAYAMKESAENREALVHLERYLVTNAIDNHWQEHLTEMEDLRRSITLRSYGQRDPLVEYKGEAFRYFQELMDNVRLQICTSLFRSATNLIALENIKFMLARSARLEGPGAAAEGESRPAPRPAAPESAAARAFERAAAAAKARMQAQATQGEPAPGPGAAPASGDAARREAKLPVVPVKRDTAKVGRNDPCPCGSGRKFKHCCGK